MPSEQTDRFKYRIGPPAELTQEIGQVVVNYSECERAIFSIFRLVMHLSDEDAYLLVKHANLHADKMSFIIGHKIDQIRPGLLADPLTKALQEFKRLGQKRNVLAHWQWAVTESDTGLAFNSIKGKLGEAGRGHPYSLDDLKTIASDLAKTAAMLNFISLGIRPCGALTVNSADWRQGSYSSMLDDAMLQYALDRLTERLDLDKGKPPSEQEPSAGKAQRP